MAHEIRLVPHERGLGVRGPPKEVCPATGEAEGLGRPKEDIDVRFECRLTVAVVTLSCKPRPRQANLGPASSHADEGGRGLEFDLSRYKRSMFPRYEAVLARIKTLL